MKKNFLSRFAVLAVSVLIFQVAVSFFQFSNVHAADTTPPPQPNIIVILADDMGWGDLCRNSQKTNYGTPGPGCKTSDYYYCDESDVVGHCTSNPECPDPTKSGCTKTNTPNLDTLALKGVQLTNYYSPAPICSPARASLLTGRYPINHGVSNQNPNLPTLEVTLAKALKKLNYSTGIVGKWHLGWGVAPDKSFYYPNERGFDYYYVLPLGVFSSMGYFNIAEGSPQAGGTPNPADLSKLPAYCTHPETGACPSSYIDFWCTDKICSDAAKAVLYDGARKKSLTEIITDNAIKFIENPTDSAHPNGYRVKGQPYFLYVALPSPHAPLDIHLPNNEGYSLKNNSYNSSSCEGLSDTTTPTRDKCCENLTGITGGKCCSDIGSSDRIDCAFKVQFRENNPTSASNYYSQVIHEIDTRVQEVIDAIPANEDTIIIFTSDNGTDMGISGFSDLEGDATYVQNSTGGLKGGKRFVFEGGVRVPFIAYRKGPNSTWPQMPVNSQLADHTDLFPTLLQAAGLNLSAYYQALNNPPLVNGQDLTAFFTSGAPTENEVQYYSTIPNVNLEFLYKPTNSLAYYPPIYAFRKYSPNNVDGLNNFKWLFDPINNRDNHYTATNTSYPSVLARAWEFYDLASDPEEQSNVINAYGPVSVTWADTTVGSTDPTVNGYKINFRYFLPSIKDDVNGWQNYITVKAISNDVPMNATLRVYKLDGTPMGQYSTSVASNGRVDQRPSLIAGTAASPVPVEGSVIIETSVPAIVSTNTIANAYRGFSINESAKPRSVHNFPKIFDGPNNYQNYLLIQNIYATKRNVTIKLFGKTVSDPGNGATMSVDIPAFGTLKVSPSDIAGGINFDGSVKVYSNLVDNSADGLGLAIPAMCRYELGTDALAIYESTVARPSLYFPVLKDGKFGGSLDYQNFLSVVNQGNADATISIYLYNTSGTQKGQLINEVIPAGGKKTWRPSQIPPGSLGKPLDFEGSAVVLTNTPVIGMTNTIYPRTTDSKTSSSTYGVEAFDLYESAIPNSTLFFPKAFDNLGNPLIDNYVYIQNPDSAGKNVTIEQINASDSTLNGSAKVPIGPNATHVFRPKDLVTDGTGTFRGSIKITETTGKQITGAMKYEVHNGTTASSYVEAITIYRSMGQ